MNLRGDLMLADQDNYNKLGGLAQIAYLCCDDPDKEDNFSISPNKMLNQLMGANLSAIILYSARTNWCSFDRNDGPGYQSIVTMADKGDAANVLTHIQGKASNETLHVSIIGNATVGDTKGGKGRSHSTVAMSVLYSITGLITVLFLAIIITGTVRAHRHPERYGPRSGFGRRPRQSRAKGIARAVLDTLPIVKFGNEEHGKPDPELELEPATDARNQQATPGNQETAAPGNQEAVAAGGLGSGASSDKAKAKETAESKDIKETNEAAKDTTETEHSDKAKETTDGVPDDEARTPEAAIAESASAAEGEGDEHLGCSICTEDFTMGEDVRVLPCNHQFHPGCVDPWLVNVSGTCPLCRFDLQPGRQTDASEPGLPPPLGFEVEDDESGQTRSRASRLFEMNRLRHLSQQERIAALREMRSRREDDDASQASDQTDGEGNRATRLAARLRDKFRIRTRAQT